MEWVRIQATRHPTHRYRATGRIRSHGPLLQELSPTPLPRNSDTQICNSIISCGLYDNRGQPLYCRGSRQSILYQLSSYHLQLCQYQSLFPIGEKTVLNPAALSAALYGESLQT